DGSVRPRDGSVIDQDIQAAQCFVRMLHEPLHRIGIGNIGRKRKQLRVAISTLIQSRLVVVADEYLRTFLMEGTRDGQADTPGGARDQHPPCAMLQDGWGRMAVWFKCHFCGFKPKSSISLPSSAYSVLMCWLNASRRRICFSTPAVSKYFAISGVLAAFSKASAMRSTASSGVPAGTTMPCHSKVCLSGMPSSVSVVARGNALTGSAPVASRHLMSPFCSMAAAGGTDPT